MKRLRRIWCRWFHSSLMLPRNGRAICRICQEEWDATAMSNLGLPENVIRAKEVL